MSETGMRNSILRTRPALYLFTSFVRALCLVHKTETSCVRIHARYCYQRYEYSNTANDKESVRYEETEMATSLV